MTARQRDPRTGRFRVVKHDGQFPCCEHCGGHELYPLIPSGSHRYPCPNCHDDRPAMQKPDVCHPEWPFFHPLHGDEWNHAHARIGEAANEALIEDHRDFDMAYHHAGLEVPVREPAVAYVHGRDGLVLELGRPAQKPIASAWQVPPGDTLAVSGKPHPSGPLPVGEWAKGVTGQLPADFDQRLASVLDAYAGQDAAGNVPGPVEYPPTPGPGTPGEAAK